jgi:hypothetical protein
MPLTNVKGGADLSDADYIAYWKSRCSVNPVTGCWEWQGFRTAFMSGRTPIPGKGYAMSSYRGKRVRVNRKMLELKLGRELLPEEVTRHTCDTPWCINPDHVEDGTQKQNFIEAIERGRNKLASRTHCNHGHEYTLENTRLTVTKQRKGRNGTDYVHRVCIKCALIRCRIKAGWPLHLAESLPPGQLGYRPPEVRSFAQPQRVNDETR